MVETITARVANQSFAKVLRAVEAGREFVVTRNGIPVARIVAVGGDGGRQLTDTQERVLKRTMRRLRKGWSLGGGSFERDALYER